VNVIQASVLVVDDLEVNRDLLARRLQRRGHQVTVAEDGHQAIALVQTQVFDVILCDIMMPEMNGYQVLEFLKADPSLRHIPVIMISALSELDSIVRCIELGAEDYLLKPFNPTLLHARINACLEKKQLRDQEQAFLKQLQIEQAIVQERTRQLAEANAEILALNQQLKAENLRMRTELEVARHLQQMVLPREEELHQIPGLDIAGFMAPADEVGGDYYDVLRHDDRLLLGIGDVTGHGLESGVVMLMVQTAVRTLVLHGETDLTRLLNTMNRVIYENTRRMGLYKNLTLALAEYTAGLLRLSGQHEQLVILRHNGELEQIDTFDLGFPLGLEADIATFVAQTEIQVTAGDVIVLYTDGVPEAMNSKKEQYGLEQLYCILRQHQHGSASQIRQAIIDDVYRHLGDQPVLDDITLLVLKQQ
jgi:sigma-B regulation protein RsbU (phosphoserine phosphatase)